MLNAFYLIRFALYGFIYYGKIAKSAISICAYMGGNMVIKSYTREFPFSIHYHEIDNNVFLLWLLQRRK